MEPKPMPIRCLRFFRFGASRTGGSCEEGAEGRGRHSQVKEKRVTGPAVLRPVDEAPMVSSNGTAQWGLAAIQCLALAGEALKE